jgi:hypothetical protein
MSEGRVLFGAAGRFLYATGWYDEDREDNEDSEDTMDRARVRGQPRADVSYVFTW